MEQLDGKIVDDTRPYFIELSFEEYMAGRPDFSMVWGIEDHLKEVWQNRKFVVPKQHTPRKPKVSTVSDEPQIEI